MIDDNAFDKLLFGEGSIRIDIYLCKNVPAMQNKLDSFIITREVLILALPKKIDKIPPFQKILLPSI